MCEQLAQHYETMWCPEFAREYLLTNGTNYEYEDLLTIARGQLALEDEYSSTLERNSLPMMEEGGHLPLFIDTDMYVMKVWSEFVLASAIVLSLTRSGKESMISTCFVIQTCHGWRTNCGNIPNCTPGKKLYSIYKDIMVNQPVPWVDISGDDDARLRKGIAAIDTLLG